MIGMQSLCEAPLCGTDIIHHVYGQSLIPLEQDILFGKIFDKSISNIINLSQTIVGAYSFELLSTLTLTHQISPQLIYDIDVSNLIVLDHDASFGSIYAIAVEHSLFLTDDVVVNNIYSLSICQNIPLVHRLGWVLELSASNTLVLNFDEVEAALNILLLEQNIETNLDDFNCLNPTGTGAVKDGTNTLNISQSLDGKMVFMCPVTSNLELLQTVAWR